MNEDQKNSAKRFLKLFVSFMLGCGLVFGILSLVTYLLRAT